MYNTLGFDTWQHKNKYEENEGKKVLNFFCLSERGGGRATLRPLATMTTVNHQMYIKPELV